MVQFNKTKREKSIVLPNLQINQHARISRPADTIFRQRLYEEFALVTTFQVMITIGVLMKKHKSQKGCSSQIQWYSIRI